MWVYSKVMEAERFLSLSVNTILLQHQTWYSILSSDKHVLSTPNNYNLHTVLVPKGWLMQLKQQDTYSDGRSNFVAFHTVDATHHIVVYVVFKKHEWPHFYPQANAENYVDITTTSSGYFFHTKKSQTWHHTTFFRSRAVNCALIWTYGSFLTLLRPPQLLPLLTCQVELLVLSKSLHLDKQILIKRIYSRYRIYSLPQSLGLTLPWWQGSYVCVYMCSRPPHPTGPRSGLLWADGHNCQSTESSRRGGLGGSFKSLCSQIDFSNLDVVILFSTRQKVVPFNPQCHPHLQNCKGFTPGLLHITQVKTKKEPIKLWTISVIVCFH